MKAISLVPGTSTMRLRDLPEPSATAADEIKVRTIRVGICGTDREEAEGGRALAPEGRRELVIGHEMLGRVVETGPSVSRFKTGDLVVFTVRRGCHSCLPCAMERSDMCLSGGFRERGIWGLDGYQAELVVDSERYAVRVPPELEDTGVLTEPLSVAEKAVDEAVRIQTSRLPGSAARPYWLHGRRCLVAGLGPIGLLAAVSLRLRGAAVYGLDIVDQESMRPRWLAHIGGTYIDARKVSPQSVQKTLGGMELIFEATGVAAIELNLLDALDTNGIYVLTGIPGGPAHAAAGRRADPQARAGKPAHGGERQRIPRSLPDGGGRPPARAVAVAGTRGEAHHRPPPLRGFPQPPHQPRARRDQGDRRVGRREGSAAMSDGIRQAPGRPGMAPRWTSSAKQGVGSSLGPACRVWFTLSHGIFNEIYYPRVDRACTRDMGMLVTAEDGFFSEEKRHATHAVSLLADGVPAYALSNTCQQGRYRIDKEVLTDPLRDVLLQQTRFSALEGKTESYHLYVILAPHINNRGWGNTGWRGDYKGVEMLFAERDGTCLALACSSPWLNRSVGFVGASDGWQDINRNKRITECWGRADDGNVALTGEIDLSSSKGEFVLALAFGGTAAEAGNRARASLSDGFANARRLYVSEWQEWQKSLHAPGARRSAEPAAGGARPGRPTDLTRLSAAIIHAHEAKNFPGGVIASLSVPWGFSKGDDDLGGYHLVWPRDLVETTGGLLAVGDRKAAGRILGYLQSTQEADGHWPQNMWLDGTPYWSGIQMDETAFPILLVDLALREKAIDEAEQTLMWGMVRRAASFIVRNGPVTPQDRWEEDPGYSPFTLAVEITALLCAADMAEAFGERSLSGYLRETADAWNDAVERWIYASGTDLARSVGVEGYYVRIAPPDVAESSSPAGGFVPIKNRPPGQGLESAAAIVSPDALALVRFGLRSADDPRIQNTVRVIDALLKVKTPSGPAWHRYNDDGYGEHADGSAFDGTGIGRAWPLITGERAHYELAAGRRKEAEELCTAMESFAGETGLLPEQVWDSPDIPERELFTGKPSGSAMPLLWAHAEYLKLRRSLADGKIFDMPSQTVQRYIVEGKHSRYAPWRLNQKCRAIGAGKVLRVELLRPARVHWSTDGWEHAQDCPTVPTDLGIHVADIPTHEAGQGTRISFTLLWSETGKPEGTDFSVECL